VKPFFFENMRKVNEVTMDWLETTSKHLSDQGVDPDLRAEQAIRKWMSENADDFTEQEGENLEELEHATGKQLDKIRSYFLTQRNRDRRYIDGPYQGVYYYYGYFWEVTIPMVFGRPKINALSHLKMDDRLKSRLAQDPNELKEYVRVFADSYDYAFSIEELEGTCRSDTARQFYSSGDKHLRAIKALLYQRKVSSKVIEDARMAVEMFLKAYVAHVDGLDERALKDTYRHGLEGLVSRCENVGAIEVGELRSKILAFPEVSSRYNIQERTFGDLWSAYLLTLRSALAVLRPLSGRDLRRGFPILNS
jgi:hypothetical protein